MDIDYLEMWDQMSLLVKLLMGLLAVMSMWSVGVFFERLFTFVQAKKQSVLLVPQVAKHLKDGKLKDAIAASQSKTYRYSHVGKVILAGLQEYQFQVDTGVQLEKDDVVDAVRRSIQRAAALTSSDLKRGMGALATIGSTAVFVGLLATTFGVINAFQGIAATGSGGLGAVSGGISEALMGTAFGLVVAIPAVWFFNYLTGRIEFFTVEMDNSSTEITDYFIKRS
jgi:biopolymer transport protein ExbB